MINYRLIQKAYALKKGYHFNNIPKNSNPFCLKYVVKWLNLPYNNGLSF